MRKIFILLTCSLITPFALANITEHDFFPNYNAWQLDKSGCEYKGKIYMVGEIEAMNDEDLSNFEIKAGGRASDAYAVLMECSFIVDPAAKDYPAVDHRKYVWTAFSY